MHLEQKTSAEILKITMVIRNDHPELSKYLNEMEITLPIVANPVMNEKVLLDYYHSLQALLKSYGSNH